MHDLYFGHNGQTYVMETNLATGDRTLCILTAPGLAYQLTEEAIERLDLWTVASAAWARRAQKEIAR